MNRQVVKQLIPPILLEPLRCLRRGRDGRTRMRFTGNYRNWEEALRDSSGYDAAIILERTRAALLKVKHGEAAGERDSVLLDKIDPPFPLLAGLMQAALAANGSLTVLDFGGSLGSTYFQCRRFLVTIQDFHWCIVEQPAHVACGTRDFASDELYFFSSVADCLAAHAPHALVLSSVLQYLPRPLESLAELLARRIPTVIIDRTAFLAGGGERLTVQEVPPSIYPAHYPAWFLDEQQLTATLKAAGYRVLADFAGTDSVFLERGDSYFKGFIAVRSVDTP